MLDQATTSDERHKSRFHLQTQVPPLVRTLLTPLIALSLVFIFAALTIIYLFIEPAHVQVARYFQLALFLAGLTIILVLVRRVYNEVLKPMDSVRTWASKMREGDYSADISLPSRGEFAGLLHDLSEMGRWYKEIGREGNDEISDQVRQLVRKTRSLEILYDVAASISVSDNLNDLLIRFLRMLADVSGARSGAVRLTMPDGDMRLIETVGVDKEVLVERAPMADVIPERGTRIKSVYVTEPGKMLEFAQQVSGKEESLECVVVPLLYHGDVMGAYQLLLDESVFSLSYDLHELLSSVGYHLGMAIHKFSLDAESKKQFRFRERLLLAHELHDSLAQSMVSLRFQCKAIEDSVEKSDLGRASREVDRLKEGVEKANVELRELLAHFRAPMDERGLVPALTSMIRSFRDESGLLVFTQFDCDDPRPPLHVQRQVLRIAQEALANIRKHAEAHVVRVMLKGDMQNGYHMLVEDDGHGIDENVETDTRTGEHIGLTTMRERAEQIKAELNIESEQGEGTRIELNFKWKEK